MKERCEKALKAEGYLPKRDEDDDIIVKVQGVIFIVIAQDGDEQSAPFIRVWCPKFWALEDEAEFAKAHFVTNKLNTEYRVAKINIIDNDTHGFAEFFIDPNDAKFDAIFLRMFDILLAMRMEFATLMRQ